MHPALFQCCAAAVLLWFQPILDLEVSATAHSSSGYFHIALVMAPLHRGGGKVPLAGCDQGSHGESAVLLHENLLSFPYGFKRTVA